MPFLQHDFERIDTGALSTGCEQLDLEIRLDTEADSGIKLNTDSAKQIKVLRLVQQDCFKKHGNHGAYSLQQRSQC